jgi:hypothetical protein
MKKVRLRYDPKELHLLPNADENRSAIILLDITDEAELALHTEWDTLHRFHRRLGEALGKVSDR